MGAGVVAAWRWLAEPHPLLEAVIYYGVLVSSWWLSVVLVAVVLCRAAAYRGFAASDSPACRIVHASGDRRSAVCWEVPWHPVSDSAAPLTVADRRSAQPIVITSLHLHGVTPEQVAQALAARQPAAVPVAIEADQD